MAASLLGLSSNTPLFTIEMFVYALIGGVLPALLWMWFWQHENYKHDEPKRIIFLTFIYGMIAVFAVYPIQKYLPGFFHLSLEDARFKTVTLWAFSEELMKFLAAYFGALWTTKVFNEPIDAFIYLMTAALGFAAMENTLYMLTPLLEGNTFESILNGNMRFLGANLLHVVASGALSVFLSYAFYKSKFKKFSFLLIGLIAATLLHTAFNYFIIITTQQSTLIIFSFVWLTTIILILALERVKQIKKF